MTVWPPPPEGSSKPVFSPKPTLVRLFLKWFFAAPTLLRAGFYFSLVVVMIPSVFWGIA